jgi:hypothetical protein
MKIEADAKFDNLSTYMKADIHQYLESAPTTYEKILFAEKILEIGYLNGLIIHLGRKGWRLHQIAEAVGRPDKYCRKVLDTNRKREREEKPIKTFRWEEA